MLIHQAVLDDLAASGVHISIDAAAMPPPRLDYILRLWLAQKGTLTIRNAGALPPQVLVQIARALGSRLTLSE
ncbi:MULTISPECIES: hypothetical protein [unclassified Caballeronia]|uniref:hypothetical protein n=1 Tax=unclassified Caballeronia TaxID=2646786 RepID=UPI002866C22F|nr:MULTISPECIES: hypothetical protein [unclassified Caballeronia]MDR5752229.1 hypothetical protein [Caballeronia sp. LZ024]MDR5841746.1 hypothetical protein [Caballeronia sp. LZ031]